MTTTQREEHLEPRVARLEAGLETLTKNVSDIAVAMRDNSVATNAKIDQLAIAVTNANAPKKTDWSLFISIGFFILALGSAVFWPLNKQTQDNKQQVENYHDSMVEHVKMDNHPVGEANIKALMKDVDMTKAELVARDAALDIKIQRETQLMTDLVTAKIVDLDIRLQREFNLVNDRNGARLTKLEELELDHTKRDREQLQKWVDKATGLSAPEMAVPLIHKEIQPK